MSRRAANEVHEIEHTGGTFYAAGRPLDVADFALGRRRVEAAAFSLRAAFPSVPDDTRNPHDLYGRNAGWWAGFALRFAGLAEFERNLGGDAVCVADMAALRPGAGKPRASLTNTTIYSLPVFYPNAIVGFAVVSHSLAMLATAAAFAPLFKTVCRLASSPFSYRETYRDVLLTFAGSRCGAPLPEKVARSLLARVDDAVLFGTDQVVDLALRWKGAQRGR